MQNKIKIARFGKVYGVKGWIRLYSFTEPKENLLDLTPWYIKKQNTWKILDVEEMKYHGKDLIIKLKNIDIREEVQALTNTYVYIEREQLPKLPQDEFYWHDLIGLKVTNTKNIEFGVITEMLETGANDVFVVKNGKERLIPYTASVIINVDLEEQQLVVDWDEEF